MLSARRTMGFLLSESTIAPVAMRASLAIEGFDSTNSSGLLVTYETIPNKPIMAGKTHGKDEATLGRLLKAHPVCRMGESHEAARQSAYFTNDATRELVQPKK
jgi:hypothetical protein